MVNRNRFYDRSITVVVINPHVSNSETVRYLLIQLLL